MKAASGSAKAAAMAQPSNNEITGMAAWHRKRKRNKRNVAEANMDEHRNGISGIGADGGSSIGKISAASGRLMASIWHRRGENGVMAWRRK